MQIGSQVIRVNKDYFGQVAVEPGDILEKGAILVFRRVSKQTIRNELVSRINVLQVEVSKVSNHARIGDDFIICGHVVEKNFGIRTKKVSPTTTVFIINLVDEKLF